MNSSYSRASAMIFQIRWWISSYANLRRGINGVEITLPNAINATGLQSQFNTQTIDLLIDPTAVELTKGHPSENDPAAPFTSYQDQQAPPHKDQYSLPLYQPNE